VDPHGSFWIILDPMDPHGSFWIILDPMDPHGSSWILGSIRIRFFPLDFFVLLLYDFIYARKNA
jgi:hypothetical protein